MFFLNDQYIKLGEWPSRHSVFMVSFTKKCKAITKSLFDFYLVYKISENIVCICIHRLSSFWLVLHLVFTKHNLSLFLSHECIMHPDRMSDMSFHPIRTGLHNFSSINKSYIITLKPFNGMLCLVIGSRSLVIRNTFDIPTPHLSYFIHQQEGYLVALQPFNTRFCLVIRSRSLVIRNTCNTPTPHLGYFL